MNILPTRNKMSRFGETYSFIVEYLDYFDVLGPLLTTTVAIIALYGNPFKENAIWWKRLNWRGISIATLILISVGISILNTSNNNRENKGLLLIEENRFDSLKIRLDAVTKSKDSLNSVIKKLDEDFVEATLNELKEQRRIFDENKRRILKNLLNETVFNINTYNSWRLIRKTRWINEGTPTVKFENENLKSALLIPNDDNLLTGILILKKSIDEINTGMEYVNFSEPGSKERIQNVENILKKMDFLGKNLEALYKELKNNLPEVDIKYKTGDTTSVTW